MYIQQVSIILKVMDIVPFNVIEPFHSGRVINLEVFNPHDFLRRLHPRFPAPPYAGQLQLMKFTRKIRSKCPGIRIRLACVRSSLFQRLG